MRKAIILIASIFPNILKITLYRAIGMKIGYGVRIGFGSILFCDQVEIGDGSRIGIFCRIRSARFAMGKRASIENFNRIAVHVLEMGSQATIFNENEIAGDPSDTRSTVIMGVSSSILPHCYINVARPVVMGRNVGVGGGSYLFTHGMWLSKLDGFPVSYGEITLGDDVWLPWGCFVMPGITVGSRSIVGACSVITKNVPPGTLYAGVPAKLIRDQSNSDISNIDRANILWEITEMFGSKLGREVRIVVAQHTERHMLGEECLIAVHMNDPIELDSAALLNVVFGDLDRRLATSCALWSLKDYSSSSYAIFPTSVKRWFEQARELGVRFYPIDEE